MSSRIHCFFLEPTDKAEIALRRFAQSHYLEDEDGVHILDGEGRAIPDPAYDEIIKCPGPYKYHNTYAVIGVKVLVEGDGESTIMNAREASLETGWPKSCDCGYVFTDDDIWQYKVERLYARKDSTGLVTLSKAETGAMWDAPWMGDRWRGPDGRCLVMRTPGGDWSVDGPSSSGGKWVRTGSPPNITVTPSIILGEIKNGEGVVIIPGYHGWVRDGILEAC